MQKSPTCTAVGQAFLFPTRTYPSQGLNLKQAAEGADNMSHRTCPIGPMAPGIKDSSPRAGGWDKNYKLATAASNAMGRAPSHPPRTCMLRRDEEEFLFYRRKPLAIYIQYKSIQHSYKCAAYKTFTIFNQYKDEYSRTRSTLFYSKWGKVQSAAQHPCQNALDGTSHGSFEESRIVAGAKCRNESLLGASAGLLADGTLENQHLS